MDIHPDFHQVIDANTLKFAVQLGFETGNVLVVGFQGLAVTGNGFIVDADLPFQHRPPLRQCRKQIRQTLENTANHRRGWTVLLQLTIGVLIDALVNKLAQVIKDIPAQLFQFVQLVLQVIKGGDGDLIHGQRLVGRCRFQVLETMLHRPHAAVQLGQFLLPFLDTFLFTPGFRHFVLERLQLFLLQTALLFQFRQRLLSCLLLL